MLSIVLALLSVVCSVYLIVFGCFLMPKFLFEVNGYSLDRVSRRGRPGLRKPRPSYWTWMLGLLLNSVIVLAVLLALSLVAALLVFTLVGVSHFLT